jgi:branched-chain amino acid transport system substrate-binding protein
MDMVSRLSHGIVFLAAVLFVASSSAAHAGKDVVIGSVQAVKGVLAESSTQINAGLEDAFMMANEEGGINGKRIRYIMYPSYYKADDALEKFNALYDKYHPLVMCGSSTGLGLLVAPRIRTDYRVLYGSPSFSGTLAQPGLYPSVFVSGPTYGQQVEILLKYIAKSKKGDRVAFFYSDTAFGRDPIRYGRIIARNYRLSIVAEEMVSLKDRDMSAVAARLNEQQPDYVICQGFVDNPVPQLIEACRKLGMKAKFMGTFFTANRKILQTLGPLAEGYLVVNPYAYWGMEEIPMIKNIMEYNARAHPDVKYRPNVYMQGFVTALIMVDVMRRADTAGMFNYTGLVKVLHDTRNLDTGGLTAPLTIRNNAFPVAKIWQADPATGTYVSAPLPPGLSYWINLTIR